MSDKTTMSDKTKNIILDIEDSQAKTEEIFEAYVKLFPKNTTISSILLEEYAKARHEEWSAREKLYRQGYSDSKIDHMLLTLQY